MITIRVSLEHDDDTIGEPRRVDVEVMLGDSATPAQLQSAAKNAGVSAAYLFTGGDYEI